MMVASARNLDIVRQMRNPRPHRAIGEDLDHIAHAFYLVEMVDRMTPDDRNTPSISCSSESLTYLDTHAHARHPAPLVRDPVAGLLGYRRN